VTTVSELLRLASEHFASGRSSEGRRLVERVLAFDPDQPGALALRGLQLLADGDDATVSGAADDLWRAYRSGAPAVHVLLPLAARLSTAGKAAEAMVAALTGLAERPGDGDIAQLIAVNATDTASRWFALAVALSPGEPSTLFNAAKAAQAADAPAERLLGRYRLILACEPRRSDARIQVSSLFVARKRRGLALTALRPALALDPGDGIAWEKYAVVCHDLLEHRRAAGAFDRAAATEWPPDKRHADRLFSMIYREGETDESLYRANRAWGRAVEAVMPPLTVPARPRRDRLRIAYVSPEFRNGHNHMASFGATLAAHDRDRFEIFCYSELPTVDEEAAWVRDHCDRFTVVHGLSPAVLAERVATDAPDIAVNLCCWYAESRKPFARRMAPVQVAYNNEVSTSGLATIDWRITDRWVDPPGVETWNSERLWRLEAGFSSWRLPADLPDPGPPPMTASGDPTYGVFNHLSKLSPGAIQTVAEIVGAIPGARLLLKAVQLDDPDVRRRAIALFAAAGLAEDRIETVGFVPGDRGHFAAMAKADIALDPFPFCGGKSTVDVLWMGLPVVTLRGRFPMARMGVSLLNRAGLGELVAETPTAYKEIAVGLGREPGRVAAYRDGMRRRLKSSLLMDAAAHTRDLENAYRHFIEETRHV